MVRGIRIDASCGRIVAHPDVRVKVRSEAMWRLTPERPINYSMEPMQEQDQPWFTFRILETDGVGVEVPRLAKVLEELSSAFYAIAREKLGSEAARPGPHTTKEEAIAAVRLLRVVPGSATIELAPPPSAAQGQLDVTKDATSDDVASDFIEELKLIGSGEPSFSGNEEIRRRVRSVVEEAGEIGARADVVLNPWFARSGAQPAAVRATVRTRNLRKDPVPKKHSRRRRVSGHAFMVDVEPGRQRLRIKLPDGRDMTVDVSDDLVEKARHALDQVVEVDVQEEFEGDVSLGRSVRGLEILPSSGAGSDKPPKSVEELEREQNLPTDRPDYSALAARIWSNEQEIEEFHQELKAMRRAGAG